MLRWFKRIVLWLLAIVVLCIILLIVTGNQHILYGIPKTYLIGKSKPDIDDMHFFDVSTIRHESPQPWPVSGDLNRFEVDETFRARLDSFQTTAFVVVQNDSVLFEKYSLGYSDSTLSNSFSMAKSFLGMMIGVAVEEGYIKSLDQKVSDFIPEFSDGKNAALTIRHLLQMSSGIPFGESYASPFGYMAKTYYGKNLVEETMKFRVEKDPGTVWVYEGGNSVLLGIILTKATGRTPSQYFEQKIWSCIGAESDAHWNLDHAGGMEKTFTGFYATALDFARIGKLYLHQGVWDNDTLVPPAYVQDCLAPVNIPDETGQPCDWYGLHWWLGEYEGKKFFSCRGMRGQYIIGIPDDDMVIVRLGHMQSSERIQNMPVDLYSCIEAAYSVTAQRK